jgi:transcriptional regulator with XRE-family HTH domain
MELHKALAIAVRERRYALNLSQAAAADRAGMFRPNWSRLEIDGAANLYSLPRIADALDLSVSELIAAAEAVQVR